MRPEEIVCNTYDWDGSFFVIGDMYEAGGIPVKNIVKIIPVYNGYIMAPQPETPELEAPFAGWEVQIVAPSDNYDFGTYPDRIRMLSGSCCPDRDTLFIWWSDDNSIDTAVVTVLDGYYSPSHTFTNAGTYKCVIRESASAPLCSIFRININESNTLDLGTTSLGGLKTYFPAVKEMTIEGVALAGSD